jgi:hypothetical protein
MRGPPGPLKKARTSRLLAGAMIAASAAATLTGCNNTNHDAQNPSVDIAIHWWRLETPPSVATEYFGCFGTTGIIVNQSDGNLAVLYDDNMCPKNGAPYQLVTRSGANPAVIVGTYRLVPPDSTGRYAGTGSS